MSRVRSSWMCVTCLLLMATLLGATACRASQRGSDSADAVDLRPPPAPVRPSDPIAMAPPRLWLFDSETDTAEPAEFTGYGGKWSIDRMNPSPRYYQSLCHVPSPPIPQTPYGAENGAENGRRREGDMAIADGAHFSNVDLSAYIKVAGEGPVASAGFAFGVIAGDDFYLARIFPAERRAELGRVRPRGHDVIASGEFGAGASDTGTPRWHLVRVRAFGTEIEFFIDDVLVTRGPIDGISPGMIGLWADGSATACFDEVAAAPR